MPFQYFHPSEELSSWIQCYWTLQGGADACDVLYPDGCIDVIINFGKQFMVTQKNVVLDENSVYLGGALTEAIYETIPPDIYLLGVRFTPGCFGHFYPARFLSDLRDNCLPMPGDSLPSLQKLKHNTIETLDRFYLNKLKIFHNPVKKAASVIIKSGGNISLPEIASACNKSQRQTERLFNQYVGLTPKQFCKIIKYQHTQELLNTKYSTETLLGIALEAGYYDHAHLSKAYKRITRRNPSEQ